MKTSTKAIGGGILLLGLYALLKPKPVSDVVVEGEPLVLGPPTPSTTSLVAEPRGPEIVEASVEAMQTALVNRGFSLGRIDGAYGPKTEAAWRAYARSKGLPDSIEPGINKGRVWVAQQTINSLNVLGATPSFVTRPAPRPATRDTSSMVATPVTSAPAAAPAPVAGPVGTPGTLRVDVDLDVNFAIVGMAMDKVRSDVLAPTKLKNLLSYVAKTCPTVPRMTGPATGQVAKGGSGVVIVVRVPVLFT
jgi:peptidoglycan hydrolase-like protein with peptidoglycan-binding domain